MACAAYIAQGLAKLNGLAKPMAKLVTCTQQPRYDKGATCAKRSQPLFTSLDVLKPRPYAMRWLPCLYTIE